MTQTIVDGQHLTQSAFHKLYEAADDAVTAELIGGIVHLADKTSRKHGRSHALLVHWLWAFDDATPGVEVYDNVTTIMGEDSEPQPDVCLVIHPDCGGQMRFTDDDYLEGAPELAVEVASCTESYDLHAKKKDYEKAGVKECLVVALRQSKVFWFVNQGGRFAEQEPDADGRFCSTVFPGLWLDPNSLLELNSRKVLATLKEGLATKDHAEFAEALAKSQQ